MRSFFVVLILAVLGVVFFLVFTPRQVEILPGSTTGNTALIGVVTSSSLPIPALPEAARPTSTDAVLVGQKAAVQDIERQPQLPTPPEIIRGLYLTGWSAGSASKINSIINLINRTELNAVVIDIKDYSGYMSYKTGIKEVKENGAEKELRILRPNAMIKKLHDAGIYVIARQTVFQDPTFAKARPEWAMQNASTSDTWKDDKGLAWMDPATKPVWDYNVAIAKDAFSRGFDEVNFDYIRFASDGDLSKIQYPFWDKITPRRTVIGNFFKYLRENLAGEKISADIFGLATVNTWNDMGIGQVIEDAYEYFDYVSPMVYPSHYAKGFMGYQNPAEHPYEVVKYSMDRAAERLKALANGKSQMANSSSTATSSGQLAISHTPLAKLRPWLQDFDLGATYDAAKVKAQIHAVYDAFSGGTQATSTSHQPPVTSNQFGGWFLWDPTNRYTEGALLPTND